MDIFTLLPPADIGHFVNGILVIETNVPNNHFTLPLYANGFPTMVFQTVAGDRSGTNIGNLTLYGQTIRPEKLTLTQPFTLIAYFMRPHIIQSFFGISAGELTDGYAALGALKPIKDTGIVSRLLDEQTLNGRLGLLNNFIKLLSCNLDYNPMVLFATQHLKNNIHANALAELQAKLNISERSLQRLFENNVGISPKMYKRISQFDMAFKQLNQHDFNSLTEVAYQNGYADQSHYIRVFKEFTSIGPKEYLNMSKPFNPKF